MEPALMEAVLVVSVVLLIGTWVGGRWGLPGVVAYVVVLALLWLRQQRS